MPEINIKKTLDYEKRKDFIMPMQEKLESRKQNKMVK